MQFIVMLMSLALLAVSAKLTVAVSLPDGLSVGTRDTSPIPGYAVSPLQFSGTIHGIHAELNGTIEEIYAQMEQLHPHVDFNSNWSDPDNTSVTHFGHGPGIEDAQDGGKAALYCVPVPGRPWIAGPISPIQDAVNRWKGTTGDCRAEAHSCARLSCGNYYGTGGAISLCNDNDYPVIVTCSYIASYVTDLINQCEVRRNTRDAAVGGQEFSVYGWNVVVYRMLPNC